MRQLWRILTRADKVLIAAVLVVTVGLVLRQQLQARPGVTAIVEVDGKRWGSFALGRPQRLSIQGPLGISEVEIEAGSARIVGAPCPHKNCVRRGWVRRQGEMVVCVPNRLILKIEGGPGTAGVDAVSW